MKKALRKITSFLMALFMVLQVMIPAFPSKAEEINPNTIKLIEDLDEDQDSSLSITKSHKLNDLAKRKTKENKLSIAISLSKQTQSFRLVSRNDISLYEKGYFSSLEEASEEYNRVKKELNDQGLDLDISIIEDDQGFRIVDEKTYEAINEGKENENPYGENYSYTDLKVIDDFDFENKGYTKFIKEDKLFFNLDFHKYISPDPNFNLYDLDAEGNLHIKNEGDILALIRDDKVKKYDTYSLKEDFQELNQYKEEKRLEEEKAKAEEEKKAEEKAKAEEDKKNAEEKAKAEEEKRAEEKAKAEEEKKKEDKESETKIETNNTEDDKKSQDQKSEEKKSDDKNKEEEKKEDKDNSDKAKDEKKEVDDQKLIDDIEKLVKDKSLSKEDFEKKLKTLVNDNKIDIDKFIKLIEKTSFLERGYEDKFELKNIIFADQYKNDAGYYAASDSYPYELQYFSHQYFKDGRVNWDIYIDTQALKDNKINFDNVGLSIYVPKNQGLSDFKISVENAGYVSLSNKSNDNLVLYTSTINKANLPDGRILIKASAKPDLRSDTYSLGVRLTPNKNYIKELLDQYRNKYDELKKAMPWIIPILNEGRSNDFANGFNLIDIRLTAELGSNNYDAESDEILSPYHDDTRSVVGRKNNQSNGVNWQISDLITLRDIKNGYKQIDLNKVETKVINKNNPKEISPSSRSIKYYIPNTDGTYRLSNKDEKIPGTIIVYNVSTNRESNPNNRSTISVPFDNKTDEHGTVRGGLKEASLMWPKNQNVNQTRIAFFDYKVKQRAPMSFKVMETGLDAYCINLGKRNPVNITNNASIENVDSGSKIRDRLTPLNSVKGLRSPLYKQSRDINDFDNKLLDYIKRVFFYQQELARENNLDIVNNEEDRKDLYAATQTVIFDVVSNEGDDYFGNADKSQMSVSPNQKSIDLRNKLKEKVFKGEGWDSKKADLVKINLHATKDLGIQNVISGEVEKPVNISKLDYASKKPVEGAEFEVHDESGNFVTKFTSSSKPQLLYLKPGIYRLIETQPAPGYRRIRPVIFSVEENTLLNRIQVSRQNGADYIKESINEPIKSKIIKIISGEENLVKVNDKSYSMLEVFNTRPPKSVPDDGEFTINKTDDKGAPLKGAKFALYKGTKAGEALYDLRESDQSGQVHFNNLAPGTYTLVEDQAPKGYKKSTKQWRVFVTNDGKVFISEVGEVIENPSFDFGRDITNSIRLEKNSTIEADNNLNTSSGTKNNLNVKMYMSVNGEVNPGDYFTIEESDTLHYNMLQPDKLVYPPIVAPDGRILAKPVASSSFDTSKGVNKRVHYVFTEAVAGLQDVKLSLDMNRSVNVNVAKYNQSYDFFVNLGKQRLEKRANVTHVATKMNSTDELGIKISYEYTNDQNSKYIQLAYINPTRRYVSDPAEVLIYPVNHNKFVNRADIGPGKTKVKVYKFTGNVLPDAVIFDQTQFTEVPASDYEVTFGPKGGTDERPTAFVKLNKPVGTDTYLVRVESEMDLNKAPEAGKSFMLGQTMEFRTQDGKKWVNMSNAIGTVSASGDGGGVYTPPELDVPNEKEEEHFGKFEINKVDNEDKPVSGAVFELKSLDGEVKGEYTSNESGKVEVDNIKQGIYTLREKQAPAGYIKSDKIWYIEVDKNGITKVSENDPRSLIANRSTEPLSRRFAMLFVSGDVDLSDVATSDVTVANTTSNKKLGSTTVSTSARHISGNEFEVSVNIKAGQDKTTKSPVVSAIILDGKNITDNEKQALYSLLDSYDQNSKVGLYIYNTDNRFKKIVSPRSPGEIKSELYRFNKGGNATVGNISEAFKTAAGWLQNSNLPKEVVHISGVGINPNDRNLQNAVNSLSNVPIKNVAIGNIASGILTNWNMLAQKARVRNISSMNAQRQGSQAIYNHIQSNATRTQKSVDNARLTITANDNFDIIDNSISSNKSGGGSWHRAYNRNTRTIDLNNGELTLPSNGEANIIFRVRANGNLTPDQAHKLINDIAFKPNANEGDYTIASPTVSVKDSNVNITVKANYRGNKVDRATITAKLKRRIISNGRSQEDPYFEKEVKFEKRSGKALRGLDKTDQYGRSYEYYLADTSIDNQEFKIDSVTPGSLRESGDIVVNLSDNNGVSIRADWQGLNPAGDVTVSLSNGKNINLNNSNNFNQKLFGNEARNVQISSVNVADGYSAKIVETNGNYTIYITKDDNFIPKVKVVNKKKESFKIKKVSKENPNQVLPNAEFTVYEENATTPLILNGQVVKAVSGEDGYANFKSLNPGTYVIKETKAPEGYKLTDKTWKIRVDDDYKVYLIEEKRTSTTDVNIANGTSSRLTFTARDNSGYYRTFNLLDVSSSLTDNKDGTYNLSVNLQKLYGNQFRGYFNISFDTDQYEVLRGDYLNATGQVSTIIDAYAYSGNQTLNYTIRPKNAKNGTFSPIKEMEFYNNQYRVSKVDDSAYVKVNVNTSKDSVETLLDESNDFTFTVENERSQNKVTIKKVDENGKTLKGAEFKVFDKVNNKVLSIDGKEVSAVSGDDGLAVFKNIPKGSYVIKETSAPDGYISTNEEFAVTVNDDLSITEALDNKFEITFTAINKRPPEVDENKGKIDIYKKDDKGNLLSGAKFGLYKGKADSIDKSSEIQKTSDNKGHVEFINLEPGEYTLKELEAPDGYKKTDDSWTVKVYQTGYTVVKKNPTVEQKNTENPKNVNDKVRVSNYNFNIENDNRRTIYPNRNEFFHISYNLSFDKGIKAGDYFETAYDSNIRRQGTIKNYVPMDIEVKEGVLATAKYDEKNKVMRYTFTSLIEELDNVEARIEESLNIDRYKVLSNNTLNFTNKVANKPFTSEDMNIKYEPYSDNYRDKHFIDVTAGDAYIKSSSFINKIDYDTTSIDLVDYVNFRGDYASDNIIQIKNNDGAIINPRYSEIEVYKVYGDYQPQSFGVDFNSRNLVKVNNAQINYYQGNIAEIYIPNSDYESKYIVRLKTKFNPNADSVSINTHVFDRYNNAEKLWLEAHSIVKPGDIDSSGDVKIASLDVINKKIETNIYFNKIDGRTNESLDGVEFILYKYQGDKSMPVNKDGEIVGNKENAYKVTSKDGKFGFNNLGDGTYEVYENKSIQGYIKPSNAVYKFKVENGKIKTIDLKTNALSQENLQNSENNRISIKNYKANYPHTGGYGPIIYSIVGLLIMVIAISVYYRRNYLR